MIKQEQMTQHMNKLKEQVGLYLSDNLSISDKKEFERDLLQIPNHLLENEKHLLFSKSLVIFRQHKQLKNRYQSIISHYKHSVYNNLQYVWHNQRITISIAACVGFFIAIITGVTYNFFSSINEVEKINLLSKKIERVEYYQKNTNNKTGKATHTAIPNSVVAKSSGTGFLIKKGLIITSLHTLKKADSIFIVDKKDVFYKANMMLQIDSLDVAVLEVEDKSFLSKYKNIPYGFKGEEESIGEHLFSLGYPGIDLNYTEGFIAATENGKNKHIYHLFLPANPGTSGSPIINEDGDIVGIISGKNPNIENGVLAYKSSILLKALKKKDIALHEKNIGVRNSKKQQINKASNYVYRIYCY